MFLQVKKFSLYLGVNENVKVKREVISKKVDDILVYGVTVPEQDDFRQNEDYGGEL